MANKNYINTKDVVALTGRPYDEILNLVKTGVLAGHKTRRAEQQSVMKIIDDYN